MRRSEAGRAVLLALLAAHFQASPALLEKKGKAARAAVFPVLGGRDSAGPPRNARLGSGRRGTSGARRGGPRSPERGFPVRCPALRRVDAPASAWCGAGASRHVRQQSARARGPKRGAGSIPPPRTSGTGAALRTRAPPPGRLSDPASPPPGAPLTRRLGSSSRTPATCAARLGGPPLPSARPVRCPPAAASCPRPSAPSQTVVSREWWLPGTAETRPHLQPLGRVSGLRGGVDRAVGPAPARQPGPGANAPGAEPILAGAPRFQNRTHSKLSSLKSRDFSLWDVSSSFLKNLTLGQPKY